jgi:NADH-quinone oxidoreductase chain G
MGLEPTVIDATDRRFTKLSYFFTFLQKMSYFKINDQKYNYSVEFSNLKGDEQWKTNAPVIEYCSHIGVKLPHYCYHKDLSISGNCRMCLIEIRQANKPVVSCAVSAKSTLIQETEVFTNSPIVKKARENILEFLLLNHPLDCPICDQGGECDLQDQSLFFGATGKRFYNYKRIVTDKNISPIIKTVMSRCIHCTRCIRFAREIAGVDSLGTFGRSSSTEIGTYIEKTFQSEISGSIIDICPVGAFTSKLYPYSSRTWELKGLRSIDFSDGFCLDVVLQVKNKKIIKIQPSFNKNETEWISDKTRFSFDGLLIKNVFTKKKRTSKSWLESFDKLIKLIYFYDHLCKHNLTMKPIIIVFGQTISNESINLLTFISKIHPFIKIRRNTEVNNNTDIEKYFKLNSVRLPINFDSSGFCLLIGVNPKNEGFYLNVKLRQRYLKGGFKLFSMFSTLNLTYSTNNTSTNPKTFRMISEGNHVLSQNFTNAPKPLVILSQRICDRIDSKFFFNAVFVLESYTRLKKDNWSGFNLISNSLNSVGISSMNLFVGVSNKDFTSSSCFFFINCSTNMCLNLKKLLQLKLFNYLQKESITFKIQNFIINLGFIEEFDSKNVLFEYLYLPSTNFYENSGTFINTIGVSKLSTKILTSTIEKKADWEILRILLVNSKTLTSLSSSKKLVFLNWNINRLRNFLLFLNYASCLISSLSFYLHKESQLIKIEVSKFKRSQTKVLGTKLKRYIYEFYLSSESYYSKISIAMSECSNLNRINVTNFI